MEEFLATATRGRFATNLLICFFSDNLLFVVLELLSTLLRTFLLSLILGWESNNVKVVVFGVNLVPESKNTRLVSSYSKPTRSDVRWNLLSFLCETMNFVRAVYCLASGLKWVVILFDLFKYFAFICVYLSLACSFLSSLLLPDIVLRCTSIYVIYTIQKQILIISSL